MPYLDYESDGGLITKRYGHLRSGQNCMMCVIILSWSVNDVMSNVFSVATEKQVVDRIGDYASYSGRLLALRHFNFV